MTDVFVCGDNKPNRPSAEGARVGAELARLTEETDDPMLDERCSSCAFRARTFPNKCLHTALEALWAVTEVRPFLCHQLNLDEHKEPTMLCRGWLVAVKHSEIGAPKFDELFGAHK